MEFTIHLRKEQLQVLDALVERTTSPVQLFEVLTRSGDQQWHPETAMNVAYGLYGRVYDSPKRVQAIRERLKNKIELLPSEVKALRQLAVRGESFKEVVEYIYKSRQAADQPAGPPVEPTCPDCGAKVDRPRCMMDLDPSACPRHELRDTWLEEKKAWDKKHPYEEVLSPVIKKVVPDKFKMLVTNLRRGRQLMWQEEAIIILNRTGLKSAQVVELFELRRKAWADETENMVDLLREAK
jgi:hypothetical protein